MTAQKKTEPLSRERIVTTAVSLADADGFQSLSMRNIAEDLGAGTMALYRHVANKEDLLDAYTYGFALQESTIPFETPEESGDMAATTVGERGDEYPYLAEVVVELGARGYDYTEEFEFGLDLILDGLERYRRTIRARARSKA